MNSKSEKPLSPHLLIYKWQINMFLSILHRISGFALYCFLIVVIWWFSLSIIYPESQAISLINQIALSKFGKTIIGLCSFFFYYHLFNGLRHLFWDLGTGFEIRVMKFTSLLVLFCSSILTIMTFVLLFL
jgi:succinate dehydrogenase / fumarate reductase cytochrome b subunit